MNILIADDHELIREGLKRILGEAGEIDAVGEAEDAASLLVQLRNNKWDVLVLDINMPDRSGLEVLKDVRKDYPGLPVLVLSMYPEEQYAIRVMKAGASGYLTKSGASSDLISALIKLHQGGRYISATLADRLADELDRNSDQPPHETLSDREFEVFKLIADGKTVGEIAENLSLSVKTISTYRTHILGKMNLRNNAEIMHYAMEHHMT
jgi:DNA-binding NarL/FixJ family response regulator